MKIDKDGKLDMFGRQDMRILEEFGWNVEDMATAIRELRDELDKKIKGYEEQLERKDKEIERANDAINNQ